MAIHILAILKQIGTSEFLLSFQNIEQTQNESNPSTKRVTQCGYGGYSGELEDSAHLDSNLPSAMRFTALPCAS